MAPVLEAESEAAMAAVDCLTFWQSAVGKKARRK